MLSGAHGPAGRIVSFTKNSGWTRICTPSSSRRSVTSGIQASLLVTKPSRPTPVSTALTPCMTSPGTRSSWPANSIGVRYVFTCLDTSRPFGSKTKAMLDGLSLVAS